MVFCHVSHIKYKYKLKKKNKKNRALGRSKRASSAGHCVVVDWLTGRKVPQVFQAGDLSRVYPSYTQQYLGQAPATPRPQQMKKIERSSGQKRLHDLMWPADQVSENIRDAKLSPWNCTVKPPLSYHTVLLSWMLKSHQKLPSSTNNKHPCKDC